jgi:hypothetical protein
MEFKILGRKTCDKPDQTEFNQAEKNAINQKRREARSKRQSCALRHTEMLTEECNMDDHDILNLLNYGKGL